MTFFRLFPVLLIGNFLSVSALAVETTSPVDNALENRPAEKMKLLQAQPQRPRDMIEQRSGVTRNHLTTKQVGSKTVVTGTIINHGNVNTSGSEVAEAVGAKIDLSGKTNVQVNATLVQHGNVNATASNQGSASATAAGAQVDVTGARNANVNVKTIVHGNINASATGSQSVESVAVGTQIKSDAQQETINVNTTSGAAIRAISQGQ